MSILKTRLISSFAATLLLAGGMVAVDNISASALGSDCNAWVHTSGNSQQGQGKCRRVNSDTKVRVYLNIPKWPDATSDWFHDINRVHATSWVTKWRNWGASAAAIEQARR